MSARTRPMTAAPWIGIPLLLLAVAGTPAGAAAGAPPPAPAGYQPFAKPASAALTAGDSRSAIRVKFAEGAPVRLRDGVLRGPAGPVAVPGTARRLFPQSEEELAALSGAALRSSGRVQADLNQYYEITLRPGADPVAALAELLARDIVEIAYPTPLPVVRPGPTGAAAAGPAAAATPSFVDRQRYRQSASVNGVDVEYARTVPGGTGKNVRVHDIEGGWVRDHEDMTSLRPDEVFVPQGSPAPEDKNHGTAVMGTLIGDDNPAGVTGLVPQATPRLTNDTMVGGQVNRGGAIATAAKVLRPGDVMLLEMQMNGCTGGFAPVEWEPATYDAIVAATSLGITVVEPAGNGSSDLDAPCNGSPFPRGKPDSGAIIVGAGGAGPAQGCSTARQKLGFSTFGRRVDLQAWGECVVTTGYGDLQKGTAQTSYTARFSGTSSASPIVAGSAAALSSIARERGRTLTPAQIRDLLVRTGSPQAGGGKIGPLPNLRAAVAALEELPVR
ncbi:hypothetical protein GCM10010124_22410 [Pilimelia terevasa]|uniref:Peptidase S8/S53 domain-containing protein n=1 Tax=Pilimelia terevasa TaxID=53372 RepID=A0A8J3FKM9_9ACTN|nr:S8 family serine peptidase [Pilimelia terevasa]GGK29176.1 hypothetical protein GCM10010124_22410 [Pilimelia terevasa]